MTRLTKAEKLQRATRLRDCAVDLVAHGGKLVAAKKQDQTIEIMAYEGERIAILTTRHASICAFAVLPITSIRASRRQAPRSSF
ncbi:hypothetical protein [Bradyrhizobium sp. 187]|jgi:hypothetical protein|uniref:hypothetical protein n=1 Tax=Bradyrhizobium sp. 187 TaxID=2782655 RepID=UPI0020001ED1|nr:hypothetical protein [Bradyrhizobium sp. 187]UPJ76734.1 hypothetical protein IVB19_30535 [Bradyrhizobium sp. 187]